MLDLKAFCVLDKFLIALHTEFALWMGTWVLKYASALNDFLIKHIAAIKVEIAFSSLCGQKEPHVWDTIWTLKDVNVSSNGTFFVAVFLYLPSRASLFLKIVPCWIQREVFVRSLCLAGALAPGVGSPLEILCGVPEQLWVERGATERSPLVCWACVRVLRSQSIAQLVLLVEICGAPGLGQGSRFMPHTEASFNLLQRHLRTRAALFVEPRAASLWPGAVRMGFFCLFLYWDI